MHSAKLDGPAFKFLTIDIIIIIIYIFTEKNIEISSQKCQSIVDISLRLHKYGFFEQAKNCG